MLRLLVLRSIMKIFSNGCCSSFDQLIHAQELLRVFHKLILVVLGKSASVHVICGVSKNSEVRSVTGDIVRVVNPKSTSDAIVFGRVVDVVSNLAAWQKKYANNHRAETDVLNGLLEQLPPISHFEEGHTEVFPSKYVADILFWNPILKIRLLKDTQGCLAAAHQKRLAYTSEANICMTATPSPIIPKRESSPEPMTKSLQTDADEQTTNISMIAENIVSSADLSRPKLRTNYVGLNLDEKRVQSILDSAWATKYEEDFEAVAFSDEGVFNGTQEEQENAIDAVEIVDVPTFEYTDSVIFLPAAQTFVVYRDPVLRLTRHPIRDLNAAKRYLMTRYTFL